MQCNTKFFNYIRSIRHPLNNHHHHHIRVRRSCFLFDFFTSGANFRYREKKINKIETLEKKSFNTFFYVLIGRDAALNKYIFLYIKTFLNTLMLVSSLLVISLLQHKIYKNSFFFHFLSCFEPQRKRSPKKIFLYD